jgi:hypothetical protein
MREDRGYIKGQKLSLFGSRKDALHPLQNPVGIPEGVGGILLAQEGFEVFGGVFYP